MSSSACNYIHGTCTHLAVSDMYYVPPHPHCAMAEAVKSLVTNEAWLQSQTSICGMHSVRSGTETGFL